MRDCRCNGDHLTSFAWTVFCLMWRVMIWHATEPGKVPGTLVWV